MRIAPKKNRVPPRDNTKVDYFSFRGGMDLVTPPEERLPGRADVLINFEPTAAGGYAKVQGLTRTDQRYWLPQEATFILYKVDTYAGLSLNDVVTHDTSGYTGWVCGFYTTGGDYYLGVTHPWPGNLFAPGTLNTAAYTVYVRYTDTSGVLDVATAMTFKEQAEDAHRADIAQPGGYTGNSADEITGIHLRDSDLYAFRYISSGGGVEAYRCSTATSGWVQTGIELFPAIYFDAGGGGAARALPTAGATITGGTSGATGFVVSIIDHLGAVSSNDAEGYMVLSSVSGTFQDNEAVNVGGTQRATTRGTLKSPTLASGGNYQFTEGLFYGEVSKRVFFSDGDALWELNNSHKIIPVYLPWDDSAGAAGGVQVPCRMVDMHQNCLIATGDSNAQLYASVSDDPRNFSGFYGAVQLQLPTLASGVKSTVGNVLAVGTSNGLYVLAGRLADPTTLTFDKIADVRVHEFTMQNLDTLYFCTDTGVSSLERVDVIGNFVIPTISEYVAPLYRSLLTGAAIEYAFAIPSKRQYHICLSSTGDTLVMYVPPKQEVAVTRAGAERAVEFFLRKLPSGTIGRMLYGYVCKDISNREHVFTSLQAVTALAGFVHEDQLGGSFEGEPIRSFIRSSYSSLRDPMRKKKWRRADFSLRRIYQPDDNSFDVHDNYGYDAMGVSLKLAADINYTLMEASSVFTGVDEDNISAEDADVPGRWEPFLDAVPGLWETVVWEEYWAFGHQGRQIARMELGGSSEAIALLLYHESSIFIPFVVDGVTIHYDVRRNQR